MQITKKGSSRRGGRVAGDPPPLGRRFWYDSFMARISPLRRRHQEAEASLVSYGPADHADGTVELVETYGELELEYAALRKHCVLLDQPNRAVLEVVGRDRLAFLNNMLTQDLRDMGPHRVRRAFWLNKKGRIDSDVRVIDLPNRTLLDVDIHAADRTLKTLNAHIIADDVTISPRTEQTHRFALHGPTGLELLKFAAELTTGADASGPLFDQFEPGTATVIRVAGHEVVVFREDCTGEPGLELIAPAAGAAEIYEKLLAMGRLPDGDEGDSVASDRTLASRVRLRPAGWHAFNIARIEEGTPLFNIDFGTDSQPGESGVLDDRVSFKKGCYPGQEIVARIAHRGHPKQRLVAIKFESVQLDSDEPSRQPVTGSQLHPSEVSEAVGVVTSSTFSPMLGATPIAFGQVKWNYIVPGTVLIAMTEGGPVRGVVQPTLRFWSRTPRPD